MIYPYAAKSGALCNYCLPQDVTANLKAYLEQHKLDDFLADFRYLLRMNSANVIVNNDKIVTEIL